MARGPATTPNTHALGPWLRRLACPLLLLFASAAVVPADDPPPPLGSPSLLPAALTADFDGSSFAMHFRLTSSTGGTAAVSAWFSSQESAGQLHFKTIFSGPTSYGMSRRDDVSTSFQPTAICQRSGETDTIYVAGWFSRQRMAVIEEWSLQPVAIGEAMGTGGNGPHPTMSSFQFDKRLLLTTTGVTATPFEAMACDPFADELIVLEYGPQARLSRIDLSVPAENMALMPLADVTSTPQLAQVKSMRSGFHQDHGLVMVLRQAPAWHVPQLDPVRAFYDVTANGLLDYNLLQIESRDDWTVQFPSGGWQDEW